MLYLNENIKSSQELIARIEKLRDELAARNYIIDEFILVGIFMLCIKNLTLRNELCLKISQQWGEGVKITWSMATQLVRSYDNDMKAINKSSNFKKKSDYPNKPTYNNTNSNQGNNYQKRFEGQKAMIANTHSSEKNIKKGDISGKMNKKFNKDIKDEDELLNQFSTYLSQVKKGNYVRKNAHVSEKLYNALLDSGCNEHFINDRKYMKQFLEYDQSLGTLSVADGNKCEIKGKDLFLII
jgi:hypothetical protein